MKYILEYEGINNNTLGHSNDGYPEARYIVAESLEELIPWFDLKNVKVFKIEYKVPNDTLLRVHRKEFNRKKNEAIEAENIKKSALSKLTSEERKALNI